MASEDEGSAAACSSQGAVDGGTSTTTRFVVRKPVPHWSVAEFKRLYPNMLDARRFMVMFSDGRNALMLGRVGIRCDTEIGAWERWWASFGSWCTGVMDPIGRFDMRFVRHAEEVCYVRALRWVMCRAENDWPAMGLLELVRSTKPHNNFYLVRDADDWSRE